MRSFNIILMIFYIIFGLIIQFSGLQSSILFYITPIGCIISLVLMAYALFKNTEKLKLSSRQNKRYWIMLAIIFCFIFGVAYLAFIYTPPKKGEFIIKNVELLNYISAILAISSNHLMTWLNSELKF